MSFNAFQYNRLINQVLLLEGKWKPLTGLLANGDR